MAVVLTEPFYSREAKYQVVLPLLDRANRHVRANDLVRSTREWTGVFPIPHVLFPIPTTHSVWHVQAIAKETEHVVG